MLQNENALCTGKKHVCHQLDKVCMLKLTLKFFTTIFYYQLFHDAACCCTMTWYFELCLSITSTPFGSPWRVLMLEFILYCVRLDSMQFIYFKDTKILPHLLTVLLSIHKLRNIQQHISMIYFRGFNGKPRPSQVKFLADSTSGICKCKSSHLCDIYTVVLQLLHT